MKQTKSRKIEHLKLCLTKDVGFKNKTTGFEDIELVYKTLPEIDFGDVNTETTLFNHKFSAPVFVAGITGGTKAAEKINKDIGKACEKLGIGMGLGSQRAMLENPKLTSTYDVKRVAPNIFLAGNLGISHIAKYDFKQIIDAIENIHADALAIHINAAQEVIQKEGNTNFKDGLKNISSFIKKSKIPIIVKEVGSGISKETVKKLQISGVKCIDVGGAGGTSWTQVEYLRKPGINPTYRDWGIPTAVATFNARKVFSGDIISTGGIRTGLDIVKAIALGADFGGIALPVLKAQNSGGAKAVEDYLNRIIREIKIGMFLVGAKNVKDLKKIKYRVFGKTKNYF